MGGHQAGGFHHPLHRRVGQHGAHDLVAGGVADGTAVLAGHGVGDAGQEVVNLLDGPSGDDGERAAEVVAQTLQGVGQAVGHANRIGRRRDVEQGAVEVQQQRRAARRGQGYRHATTRTS